MVGKKIENIDRPLVVQMLISWYQELETYRYYLWIPMLFLLLEPAVSGHHQLFALQPENDQVWKIKINGNETFRDIVIGRVISAEDPNFWKRIAFWSRSGFEVNETEIRRDVIRIERFYQRRGFPHVKVSYRLETGKKDWKKNLYFEIDEGPPLLINDVIYRYEADKEFAEQFENSSGFRSARRKHAFQTGRRYEIIQTPDVIGRFTDVIKNLGYAHARVTLDARVDSSRNIADITITSIPGPRTYIDQITIDGGEMIPKSLILKESGLEPGEMYKLDKIQQAQVDLFNHHLFRFATVSIPPQAVDSTLLVNISIRENSPRTVEVLFGLGTEDIVRGQASWIHRNVLGAANRFSVTGRASFIEQSANFDYLVPYVFNTHSSIVISPFFQHLLEKSFELTRGGITNSFIYQYRENFTGTFSYQFTRNLELSQQFNVTLPDTSLTYNLSSFRLSGYYRPGFSREGQGWVIQPFAEFSGFFGAASFAFQKLSVDVRRFTRLTNSTTLATRIEAGGIYDVQTDSLPRNLRFFLGGTSSVRGWARHELGPKRARVDSAGFIRYVPVGGRATFGFNIEIRQELNSFIKGFGVAAFLDGGQVWRSPGDLGARPLQFALGGGFRYRSPIGPLRVDVGYKLNPTDEDLNIFEGEDFGNTLDRIGIHFSVGQAF